jgi:hypothetical protein
MILAIKIFLIMIALAIIGFSIATYQANSEKEQMLKLQKELMRKLQP